MMRRSDRRQRYDELLAVIRGIRRRWRLRVLVRGLAITAAAALVAVVGAGVLVDRLDPSAAVVSGLRIALGVVVAATALWYVVRPLLRRVSDEAVALYLEEHEQSLEAAVLSALDAGREADSTGPADAVRGSDDDDATADDGPGSRGRAPAISDALLVRTLEDAVRRVHAIGDGRWIERGGLIRVTAALLSVLAAGALVGFLGPLGSRQGAVSLFGSPTPAEAAGPAAVRVTPGDATISRGADVSIAARLQGFDSDLVELGVRTAGDSAFDRLPMAAGADGRHGYLLFDLDADTEYFVEAGDVRSEVFTLTVAELPYVDRLQLTLDYPAYTGLADETIAEGGDVTALRGTVVRVRVTPTLPVDGGGIVVDGADPVPLVVDSATGELTGSFRVRADGFYHIALAAPSGERVEASPRYVIDALSDGAPIVAFEEPGRDVQATAIDELFVEARAEDDYGVESLTLHYTVNGGPGSEVELYGGRGGLAEVTAGHTLYLEEYGLEPGDLVAYWATTADNDAVDGVKVATSDIYFVRIRPFSRDYSAAESRGMPQQSPAGAGGAPDGDLSELQRQIIAGTFNLVRDSATFSDAEYRENLNTLALSQERLRDQTRTLAQRMVARQVTADSAFRQIAGILPRAAEIMDTAAARLRELTPGDALPPEQRALQQLQRAEAIFREVQISMGQQGGGQPGGSPNAEDLADLFELEMDKLQDQYETVDRGGEPPHGDSAATGLDETAERLEELARRQQQEAERRRMDAARGRGTAGGDAQRELAERVEEEARRLERLSRERRQPELREAARRLQDAAESMRRAAAGDGAEGERATDELREARRMLERSHDRALRQRAESVRDEAERLAREQGELREDAEELLDTPVGPDRDERARRLQVRKSVQQDDVAELERDLRDLAGEAGREQPEVARRAQDAAGRISGSRLEEKIDFSRQLTRGGAPDRYVRELEEQIEADLDEVRDRLAGIDEAFRDREGEQDAERALEEAEDLARGLESMRQRGAEARERSDGGATGGSGFSPDAIRQGRAEAGRRLEEARELRDRLREQGADTDDVNGVIRGLQQLTDANAYRDAEELARLQATLADRAKRLELTLRISLAGDDRLRLFLEGDPSVDPEYRALVEEYYRSLSREGSSR